jgi:hypothetical protein
MRSSLFHTRTSNCWKGCNGVAGGGLVKLGFRVLRATLGTTGNATRLQPRASETGRTLQIRGPNFELSQVIPIRIANFFSCQWLNYNLRMDP